MGIIPPTVQNKQRELIPVLDSREVARMMGISHIQLLRYIEGSKSCGVIGIAEVISKVGTSIDGYFIPSTYLVNNREYRSYSSTYKRFLIIQGIVYLLIQ